MVGLLPRQRNHLPRLRPANLARHGIARSIWDENTGRLPRLDVFQSENVQQLNIQHRQLVFCQSLGRPSAAVGLGNVLVIQATLVCCLRAFGFTISWCSGLEGKAGQTQHSMLRFSGTVTFLPRKSLHDLCPLGLGNDGCESGIHRQCLEVQ